MKEIDCQTSHCEHNLKCKCMAGIISVGDNAKCLSRIKRDGGALAHCGDELFPPEGEEGLRL